MIDFETSRSQALAELSRVYSVRELNFTERKKEKLSYFRDVWEIETEVFTPDDSIITIKFLVSIPDDFPLVLPKIYLYKEDYDSIKFIPHVNTSRNVCLFDEEYAVPDYNRPGEMVKESVLRACRIIEQGLRKNNLPDFQDEFVAYWQDTYDNNDSLINCLSLLPPDRQVKEEIVVLHLKESYRGYFYVLASAADHHTAVFMQYLKERKIEADAVSILYMRHAAKIAPPFNLTNASLYDLLINEDPAWENQLKSYLNQKGSLKLIVFALHINETWIYFGWKIRLLHSDRNGFRKNTLTPFEVFTTFQKNNTIARLNFESMNPLRLKQRTDGNVDENRSLKLTIAGVGSIGSNLLQFLNSSETAELTLVDPDILTVENVSRHLLGMNYINQAKAEALKYFFGNKNPLLQINTFKKSIVDIVKWKSEVLNNSNFLFIVVGKDTIEHFIVDALADGRIRIPVFILWVEPFLCGGHCLFLNPGQSYSYENDYTDGLYRFNILHPEEYQNDDRKLLFREAGCQSSYIPYGQKNITLFLSGIIPFITSAMDGERKDNFRLTWKGNQTIAKQLDLKISDFGNTFEYGTANLTDL